MAYDTRSSNNQQIGECTLGRVIGSKLYSTLKFPTPAFVTGESKSIYSYRDASGFKAGHFTLHPVEITRTRCECDYVDKVALWTSGGVTYKYHFSGPWAAMNGTGGWSLGFLSPANDHTERAMMKAFANVHQPSLELGVELGELRETLRMLRNPLKDLRSALLSVDKLTRKRFRTSKGVDVVTGTWLEARYGIRPLIWSIQGILKYMLTGPTGYRSSLQRRTASVRDAETEIGNWATNLNSNIGGEYRFTRTVSYKAVAKVYFRDKAVRSIQQNLGLDGMYLPSMAWELTRLSFVVDWWLGVGDFLMAHTIDSSREILGSCVSVKSESEIILEHRKGRIDPGKCRWIQEKLNRTIGTNHPPDLPVVNASITSIQHSFDGLALLWQNMPKTFKR